MDQEDDIKKQISKISTAENNSDYTQINEELTKKRLAWFEEHKHLLDEIKGSDVRKAFEMILIRYIGIDPQEVPVVYEDDKKIIWHSYNWCPVLEACKRMFLDTREVCKKGWEQSVEEMAKRINPKIHFSRNYEKLRPHGEYCEEVFEIVE